MGDSEGEWAKQFLYPTLQDLETLINAYVGRLFFRPVCRQAGSRLRSSLPRGRWASFETKISIKITVEPYRHIIRFSYLRSRF